MKNKSVTFLVVLLVICATLVAYAVFKNWYLVGRENGVIEINLADEKSSTIKSRELIFRIPKAFDPEIRSTMFRVSFKYPSGEPVRPGDVVEGDVISVLVDNVGADHMRSKHRLKEVQPLSESVKKNVPAFLERSDNMDVYQYDYGSGERRLAKLYVFLGGDGNNVMVDQLGDWSAVCRVYREFNNSVELDYVFDRRYGPVDFAAIDKKVVEVIRAFQM